MNSKPGTIDGIVFGVSNDGGKTAIKWSSCVHDCIEYLDPHRETLRDYSIVAMIDKQATPAKKSTNVVEIALFALQALPTVLTDEDCWENFDKIQRVMNNVEARIYERKRRYVDSPTFRKVKQDESEKREAAKRKRQQCTLKWARRNLNAGDVIRISGTRDDGIRMISQFNIADGSLVMTQLKTPMFTRFGQKHNYLRPPAKWKANSGVFHVSCDLTPVAITTGDARNITHFAISRRVRSGGDPSVVDIEFEAVPQD